jgi:hypothetical protein
MRFLRNSSLREINCATLRRARSSLFWRNLAVRCQRRLKIPNFAGRKFSTPEVHEWASLASDAVEPSAVLGAFWAQRRPRPRRREPRPALVPEAVSVQLCDGLSADGSPHGCRWSSSDAAAGPRLRSRWVSENRAPVPVTLDDAAPFVPCAHQLEENRGSQIIERQVTDFVDHQNFRRQVDAHTAIQLAFAIRSPQVRRQVVRGDECKVLSRTNRRFC